MIRRITIREATPAERLDWDRMVSRFDNHRIFHESAWLHSLEEITGSRALYLLLEKHGEVIGCLPGFLRTIGFIRIFGSPMEGWQTESMGPAFDSSRAGTSEIMAAVLPYLYDQLRVHHVEMMSSELDGEEMRALGFEGQRIFSYRAPLYPGDDDAVLRNMKGNARNHLRKAIKLGLVARIEHDESFVAECYDQMKEVFRRRGASVPFNENRMLRCFLAMREAGNLLAISIRKPDDDLCIATGIYLVDGRELILWSWTHRTQHRALCPTELLTWTAMQEAMRLGCTVFDMTGGGDAKPKFGGQPYEQTYRWMRSRYEWIASSRKWAKRAYRWQQVLRGRAARALDGSRTNGGEAGERAAVLSASGK